MIVAGIAGFSLYPILVGSSAPLQVNWQDEARKASWIPTAECPAFPISVAVTGPGDGADVQISSPILYTKFAVASSHPIPDSTDVGLLFNQEGTSNYYPDFGDLNVIALDRRTFASSGDEVVLPSSFAPKPNSVLNVWAIATDKAQQLGLVYSSLDQITGNSTDVVLSKKVTLHLTASDEKK